jgi:hypothetical protein
MRTPVLAAALAATAVAAVPATAAGPTTLKATLKGTTEVPKTPSKGTGSASFTISADGKSIKYTLSAKGLTGAPQAAHIHFGKTGVAGGIIFPLATKQFTVPRSGTLTSKSFTKAPGVSSFTAAIKAIRAGNTYVNIHTKKYPAGEIRGQIH